jgi:predicted short-subunit dehydrogenase-like oxidoreductase (DUF2520 family)
MNVVLIGSGNVAWNLGRLLKKAKHEVLQVISTNGATATELAYVLDTESTTYWSILNSDADIYLVAVNDNALPDVASRLRLKKGLVLHTSGTVPVSVFSASSPKYGVLYPLQSLLAGAKEVPEIPFLVEGNNEAVTAEIVQFARTLSQDVKTAGTEQRQKMHVAAVLVNNFTNYLLIEAENWCVKNQLDFKQLLPLLRETASRVRGNDTASLQTGPAVRNDTATIELHRKLLNGEPELLELYNYITNRIIDLKLK